MKNQEVNKITKVLNDIDKELKRKNKEKSSLISNVNNKYDMQRMEKDLHFIERQYGYKSDVVIDGNGITITMTPGRTQPAPTIFVKSNGEFVFRVNGDFNWDEYDKLMENSKAAGFVADHVSAIMEDFIHSAGLSM